VEHEKWPTQRNRRPSFFLFVAAIDFFDVAIFLFTTLTFPSIKQRYLSPKDKKRKGSEYLYFIEGLVRVGEGKRRLCRGRWSLKTNTNGPPMTEQKGYEGGPFVYVFRTTSVNQPTLPLCRRKITTH